MAANCPYHTMPDEAFWRRSISAKPLRDIDLLQSAPFRIEKKTKIATAGSCFAQNIARYLAGSGYNYFVTEDAPRFIADSVRKKYNFGVFSARYGNLYTTAQLNQLYDRAYGALQPQATFWEEKGRWFDPFRPQIQPGGYETLAAAERDREVHFAAVRRMFEECDVFVFTLGLTECWRDRRDGAIYPVCPGCGVGSFDAERYEFANLGFEESYRHLREFIEKLRKSNPRAQVLLTVSPVPLIATAEAEHVLVSTIYSKSVLRAVAGEITRAFAHVHYFPSYDLIGSHIHDGAYFGADKRDVREVGVAHAMSMFFRHYCGVELPRELTIETRAKADPQERAMTAAEIEAELVCDEEILDARSSS